MPDAGIYSLSSLVIGAVSALATSPIGGLDLPEGSFEERIAERPSGYHATVEFADGSPAGYVQSSTPLPVELHKLPGDFLHAVLAIEDGRFTDHDGIDPFALMTAAVETLRGDVRGGSTVTQQMIKNTVLGNAPTIERKIQEAILSVRAHQSISRERIVETYLQTAWFGRGQTGVMRAPEIWFGKSWDELTLGENALLAAILRGPSYYDPYRHPERAMARRNLVIDSMLRRGWITEEEAQAARAEEVSAIARPTPPPGDGWVEALAASQLAADAVAERLERTSDRLRVTTTVAPQWQGLATDALQDGLLRLSPLRALGRLPDTLRESADMVASGDDITQAQRAALIRGINAAAPTARPVPRVVLLHAREDLATPEEDAPEQDAAWRGVHLAEDGTLQGVQIALAPGNDSASAGDILMGLRIEGDEAVATAIPEIQGAIVIMDPRDGRVLASVGGFDDRLSSFDRTRRAQRQPGSAIKAFLFAAALEQGFRHDSRVDNHERVFFDANGLPWRPRNYDRSESGPIPLHVGFERSSNLVAAGLGNMIGIDNMAYLAESAGVYEPHGMTRVLAASLGTSETSLLRLTTGYATLVNDGRRVEAGGLDTIRGPRSEEPMWSRTRDRQHRDYPVFAPATVDTMAAMMRGVTVRGTAARAFANHPVTLAGKTGTSQDHRDAWFIGTTPHVAVGVWLGRDDNQPMGSGFVGGRTAAPIAAQLLEAAHEQNLISGDGYRDSQRDSNLLWPVSPFSLQPGEMAGYPQMGPGLGSALPRDSSPGSTGQGRSGARSSDIMMGGGLY